MEDGDVPSITIPWGPAGIRAGSISPGNLIGSTQVQPSLPFVHVAIQWSTS